MRRRGAVLVLMMIALAIVGILAGVIATRFAAIGRSRAENDLRAQLRWAARTSAQNGAQGRAVIGGRTIVVSGGTARSGQTTVTVTKTASGWTERITP